MLGWVGTGGSGSEYATRSARVGRDLRGQTEPEAAQQLDGGEWAMTAATQVAQPEQTLEREREHHQQPVDQQARRVMMVNVLQRVPVLGVVKALVLDLPATLGHAVERPRPDPGRRAGSADSAPPAP